MSFFRNSVWFVKGLNEYTKGKKRLFMHVVFSSRYRVGKPLVNKYRLVRIFTVLCSLHLASVMSLLLFITPVLAFNWSFRKFNSSYTEH